MIKHFMPDLLPADLPSRGAASQHGRHVNRQLPGNCGNRIYLIKKEPNPNIVQILVQTILLGWLYMADILENPYGTHPKYDIDLDEVKIDTNPNHSND